MREYVYGLGSPAEYATLSGREILQGIIDGRFPQAPISKAMSFWIVEAGEGSAVFEGEPNEQLLNPSGGVHGGWAMTLIDSATGCAGLTTLPAGIGYTTVETKVNLSRPITPKTGRVRVEGRVVNAGRQIITAEGRILDRGKRVLAHGTSTLMVLAPR